MAGTAATAVGSLGGGAGGRLGGWRERRRGEPAVGGLGAGEAVIGVISGARVRSGMARRPSAASCAAVMPRPPFSRWMPK